MNKSITKKFLHSSDNMMNKKIHYPQESYNSCFEIEDRSFWFDHRKKLLKILLNRFPSPDIFLEIGGGNGVMSASVMEVKDNVVMIEPAAEGIRNARNRHVSCLEGTFQDYTWPADIVGTVGLFDVLEHIEDDLLFLQQLKNKMSKETSLLITVPAYQFLWSEEDVKAKHFRRYSLRELKRKLKKAGFRIQYSSYFFSFLVIPILIFRRFLDRKKDSTQEQKDHYPPKIIRLILQCLGSFEESFFKNGISLPFGASLFIVCKLNDETP